MKFSIDTVESLEINDHELTGLLVQVYVEGGFTNQKLARSLFEASEVRKRGSIIAARETEKMQLVGIVINVTTDSPLCRFAKTGEVEMHLLAVNSIYRRNGLGKLLVEKAISNAAKEGCSKMILWTQKSMRAAHNLYELLGFVRMKERDFTKNEYDFWFYERVIMA